MTKKSSRSKSLYREIFSIFNTLFKEVAICEDYHEKRNCHLNSRWRPARNKNIGSSLMKGSSYPWPSPPINQCDEFLAVLHFFKCDPSFFAKPVENMACLLNCVFVVVLQVVLLFKSIMLLFKRMVPLFSSLITRQKNPQEQRIWLEREGRQVTQ